ncbi:MAG: radical SAM protein, partial [Bacillota bacterium]
MSTVTAVLSLLHQMPGRPNSATRLFRHEPVLAWTLRRLSLANRVQHRAILCWEDQLEAVKPIAAAQNCFILSKSPRCRLPLVETVAVAQKWADGWRGGLMGTSCFDRGFYGPWVDEIRQQLQSDAILLVDPDAGLVDPVLIDSLVSHAEQHTSIELCFSQAAPGLSGVLIRSALLQRLASGNTYVGRVLNYWPGIPGRDPTALDECAPVPTLVARTMSRFMLDSDRQVNRLERSTINLNGQLMRTESQALVSTASELPWRDPLPRDVVLELNTRRATNPVYWPGRYHRISRPELSLETARKLFEELAALDDIRLTLAGVGDPLLASAVFEIIAAAHEAGIDTIHVETDLVGLDAATIRRLVESQVDIVSVHMPALGPLTYQDMMGGDSLGMVVESIRQFLSMRQELGRG